MVGYQEVVIYCVLIVIEKGEFGEYKFMVEKLLEEMDFVILLLVILKFLIKELNMVFV